MKPCFIRYIFTLYLSALSVFCATAQELDFVKTMGGAGDDGLYDLVTDNDKNIYVIGWFSITCDLDPGAGTSLMASNGSRDITLAKYDSVGNYLWGFSLGSSGQDEGSVITLDSAGNIIIAGRFVNSVDFDPGPAVNLHLSQGNRDIFLAKYSPSGSLLWASHFGSTGYDDAEKVLTDSAGNIYLGGSFQNTVDFNYGPGVWNVVSNGWDDAYVAKFGPAGTLLWVRSFGGFDGDDLSGMDLDGKGALYCSGLFSGLTDFDGGAGVAFTTAAGLSDAFLVKYNTDGDFQWVKTAGSAGIDAAYGLEVSESSIYASGKFSQTLDFDPGAGLAMRSSMGATDAFLWKLDTMGNFEWVNSYGGFADDIGMDVCIDQYGSIINTGMFRQLVQFQGNTILYTLQSLGDRDIYVSNTSSSGVLESVFQIGSPGVENSHTLRAAMGNGFFISGFYGGTTDFDPDSVNIQSAACAGVNDMFFARYRFDCIPPPLVINFDTICFGEFYVVGGNAYGLPGTYLDTLVAVGGCDSLVETHLTINPKSDFVSFQTICAGDSLIINGHVYTTDGIYIDTLVNAYGCDSLVTTHLTVQPLVTVNNPVSVCSGGFYVVGNHVYTQPGLYADTLQSITGCDSVVNTLLSFLPGSLVTNANTICAGDTFVVNNNFYTSSGVYVDSLTSVFGCDSIVITNLTVSTLDTQVFAFSGGLLAMQSGVNYQWYSCDSGQITIVPGANAQMFNPPANGSYLVVLQSSGTGCVDSSACVSVISVGINTIYSSGIIRVFPNPIINELNISSDEIIEKVTLLDINCQTVLEMDLDSKTTGLDLTNIASGMYFLRIKCRSKNQVFKIIKVNTE